MDVEVAHSVEGKPPIQKGLAVLVGLSAVVAAPLATLDLDSTKRYEDLLTRSSRLSVSLFGRIAAGGFPFTGEGIAQQAACFEAVRAARGRFESGLARADRPSAESGVDPLAGS
jgi:hypothetical protein